MNIGVGEASGRPPHLVGERLLKSFGVKPGSRQAYAFTALDFERAARAYGKVGGFAHLATLAPARTRASAPARCCSTAATAGKASGSRCGRRART